jgi:hypothetical protein
VHPVNADSVAIIDLATSVHAGTWATEWTDDLPIIAAGHVLLLRHRGILSARDLDQSGVPETAHLASGPNDIWVNVAWNPHAGSTAESFAPAADTGVQQRYYLQVSSSNNADWAKELAVQLGQAGMPSRVINPKPGQDQYRVVIGPYSSREEADQTGRKLGRPFFVYESEGSPPP